MPKPIGQRGFSINKGDLNKFWIDYTINEKGLESILLLKGVCGCDMRIYMEADDGKIKVLDYGSSQIPSRIIEDRGYGEEWKFKEEIKQALEIYREVKRILNVDEELEKYCPRFSHESEINPFNILGIDDISQLESLLDEEK